MATKKEVAKKKETMPALANQFEENAGQGFEEADKDAYAIPYLSILQSMSPQCKKSDGAYIDGAEEGMLFNSVTNNVYDPESNELFLIPCHYSRSFIEWTPREAGGGLVAVHSAEDGLDMLSQCERNERNQDQLPNGNLLVDTRSHYCLLVTGDTAEAVVVSMSSTQMKKSRKWMTVMDNLRMKRADNTLFTPPMFSHLYNISTVPESNDHGSWMGWKIETGAVVEDTGLFEQAKKLRDAIVSGVAKAADPVSDGEEKEDF